MYSKKKRSVFENDTLCIILVLFIIGGTLFSFNESYETKSVSISSTNNSKVQLVLLNSGGLFGSSSDRLEGLPKRITLSLFDYRFRLFEVWDINGTKYEYLHGYFTISINIQLPYTIKLFYQNVTII